MLAGIVGCPNSGKSTFFKALTLAEVEIANYPFTTIQPNQGVAFATTECPCRRLRVTCTPKNSKCEDGVRHIPIRVMDFAGLVPGAHEGKGLGNQFLNDLTQASGLIHVLDASGHTNAEGRPEASWDPQKTIDVLENEIDEWIKDIASKAFNKSKTIAKTQKKPNQRLEEGHENTIACSADSELALKEAAKHGLIRYAPGAGDFEVTGSLSEKQKVALEFIRRNVLHKYGSTGVQKAPNSMIFDVLNLIVVYPVANITHLSDQHGHVLPDAHLVPKGTTLKELAFRLHTDIGENFIG